VLRIGYLSASALTTAPTFEDAFRQGLRELGDGGVRATAKPLRSYRTTTPVLCSIGTRHRTAVHGTTLAPQANRALRVIPEAPDLVGGPSRTRTVDPLIKSQLLCQLS
jgi:hypothetical protein